MHAMTYLAMLHSAADVTGGAVDPLQAALLSLGSGGVMLSLVVFGLLVPKGSVENVKADRDAWRLAFERECSAHDVTRSSMQVAQNQAGLALETSRTQVAIFERLGHVPKDRESR